MSRTYRTRRDETRGNINWLYQEYFAADPTPEEIEKYGLKQNHSYGWSCYYRFLDKESKEGRAKLAHFRSDSYREFKEPGPSWFRNLFTERPLRRKAKRELHKFFIDPEYEPIIETMGKLEYWT